MTDEVAADDSDVSRSLERLVIDLLLALYEADETLKTTERGGVLQTVTALHSFVLQVADHIRRGAGDTTGSMPGAALLRLNQALVSQNEGIVDPLLTPRQRSPETGAKRGRHALLLKVRMERVQVAVALQLLMWGGLKRPSAAKEVAKILKDHPILADVRGEQPWRAIASWRSKIMESGNSYDARLYKNILDQTTRLFGERTPDLVKVAHVMLHRLVPGGPPD